MTKRLRHLKSTIQHIFVVDDDETGTLEEVTAQPITLAASDWQEYTGDTFYKDIRALEEEIINKNLPQD